MPNICSFEIKAKGSKKNLLLLADYLKADYHYCTTSYDKETKTYKEVPAPEPHVYIEEDGKKREVDHHIGYRVFEFDVTDIEHIDSDTYLLSGYGDCAWSVYCCMLEGPYSYTTEHKDEDKIERKSITLVNACKLLGIELEIFSYETGMGFAEHYYIKDGELEVSEEVSYSEIWSSSYDSYDEYYEEHKKDKRVWTREEFADNPEPIIECSFFEQGTDFFAFQFL